MSLRHQTDLLANSVRSGVEDRPKVVGAVQNDEIDPTWTRYRRDIPADIPLTCHRSFIQPHLGPVVGLKCSPKLGQPTLEFSGFRSCRDGSRRAIQQRSRRLVADRAMGTLFVMVLAPILYWRRHAVSTGDPGGQARLRAVHWRCGLRHLPRAVDFDEAEKEDIGTGGQFKVPSLAGVGMTAPYFHDGRTPSLRGAVKFMWQAYAKKANASREPTDAELDDLVAYVGSL